MRDVLTTVLELLAVAAVVFGVWLIYPPAAWITFGVITFGISYAMTRPAPAVKDEQTI